MLSKSVHRQKTTDRYFGLHSAPLAGDGSGAPSRTGAAGLRRRIKTQAVLPCAETVPMLLWALLAAGQITMRKVDGWQTLDKAIEPMTLDLAA